ncbi:MAG TPA: hypothetical protein VFT50_18055 [Baekduia sp.]|nr:hypothetical protein [Baekduia sp.]
MPPLALRRHAEPHAGVPLEDAREALAYWEQREQRLPRRAVRRRHEARAMAERWRADVTAAERAAYGRGLLGALLLVAGEGRLPESARHAGRRVALRSRQAALALVALVAAVVVLAAVAAAEALAALLRALG